MRGDLFNGIRLYRIGALIGLILLAAVLVAIGYWMLFSYFALHDDEGYILISAREYLAHGGLYEFVYSQYGPAFFCAIDILAHLGFTADHTSARLLTLACWVGTAACCAAMAWRQTASLALGIFTLAGTFLYLYFLTDEPFHPGGLIVFYLALSVFAISEFLRADQFAGAMAVLGVTAAVLSLTKINVGAFYVMGATAWGVLHASNAKVRQLAGWLTAPVLLLLAVGLMNALLAETWVLIYLGLFAVGAISLVRANAGDGAFGSGHLMLAGATAVATGIGILLWIWSRGTSVAGLLEGVFLGPLRHPVNYSYPVDWRPGTLAAAGFSLLLAVMLPWIRRHYSSATADAVIVVLRSAQVVALAVGLALILHARVVGAVFSYIIPLIWTWVVPLSRAPMTAADKLSRGFLAFALLLQFLHAYPVGGSQESWGTFLFIPLVAVGLFDVKRWSGAQGRSAAWQLPAWTTAVTILALVLLGKTALVARTTHRTHAGRMNLHLPGAGPLRLDESLRTAYRILAQNAVAHADVLFSLPGLFSFNLWTEVPTPTGKNTTLWFTLLEDTEQQEIIRALEQATRPCVIVQESLVQLLEHGNVRIEGILKDYILQNFSPAFRVEGFAFLVRNGRSIAPLGLAHLMRHTAPGDDSRSEIHAEICLVGDDMPIAAIDVRDPTRPGFSATLDASNTAVTSVSINAAGNAVRTPTAQRWPIRFSGPARISLGFAEGNLRWTQGTTLYFRGQNGEALGEARLFE